MEPDIADLLVEALVLGLPMVLILASIVSIEELEKRDNLPFKI
jgi:hypothetical protein